MTVERFPLPLLDQALALERLCFSLPWTAGMFRGELEDPACLWLAALEGDALAGYIGMRTVLDEGEIGNLAVAPAFRRRGVAARLLRGLIAEARRLELSILTLEARVSNAPAISLYTKFGFSAVGLRRGYYERPREDALLMTKFMKEDTL